MDDNTLLSEKSTVYMDGKIKMLSLNGYKKIILTKKERIYKLWMNKQINE